MSGSWYVTSKGTITSSSGWTTTSDINYKKDIKSLSSLEAYNVMFDNLKPSIFKYIENNSNRNHVGFIAQEVK
jgi:hypothetical protein